MSAVRSRSGVNRTSSGRHDLAEKISRRTSQGEVDGLACGNPRLTLLLKFPEGQMSRMTALVFAVLGSLYLPGQAFAQLTPPAGSAGAGNSAISERTVWSCQSQGP